MGLLVGSEGFQSFEIPPSLARYGLARDDTKWTVELMLDVLRESAASTGDSIVQAYLAAGNSIDNKTFERVLEAAVQGRNDKKLFVYAPHKTYLRNSIVDDPVIVVTHLLHTMESTFFDHVRDGFDIIELGSGRGEVACLLLHVAASKLKTLTLIETPHEARNLAIQLRASLPQLAISLNGQLTASESDTRHHHAVPSDRLPHVHIVDANYAETWIASGRLSSAHIFLDAANLLNYFPSPSLAQWYVRNVLPLCSMLILTHFGSLGMDKAGSRTFDLQQLLEDRGFCRISLAIVAAFREGAGRSAFQPCTLAEASNSGGPAVTLRTESQAAVSRSQVAYSTVSTA